MFSFQALGADLDLLANHIYDGWENDKSELGYVSTRCSALYGNIQAYLVSNSSKSADIENAKAFKKSSEQMLTIGMLASYQSGTSAENFKMRFQQLSQQYFNKIIANKRLNNNAFDQVLTDELMLCKVIAQNVDSAIKK